MGTDFAAISDWEYRTDGKGDDQAWSSRVRGSWYLSKLLAESRKWRLFDGIPSISHAMVRQDCQPNSAQALLSFARFLHACFPSSFEIIRFLYMSICPSYVAFFISSPPCKPPSPILLPSLAQYSPNLCLSQRLPCRDCLLCVQGVISSFQSKQSQRPAPSVLSVYTAINELAALP